MSASTVIERAESRLTRSNSRPGKNARAKSSIRDRAIASFADGTRSVEAGHIDEGLELLTVAQRLFRQLGQREAGSVASCSMSLAAAHFLIKQFPDAIAAYLDARSFYLAHNQHENVAYCNHNLATGLLHG